MSFSLYTIFDFYHAQIAQKHCIIPCLFADFCIFFVIFSILFDFSSRPDTQKGLQPDSAAIDDYFRSTQVQTRSAINAWSRSA